MSEPRSPRLRGVTDGEAEAVSRVAIMAARDALADAVEAELSTLPPGTLVMTAEQVADLADCIASSAMAPVIAALIASVDTSLPPAMPPATKAEAAVGRWHHNRCLLVDRAHGGPCVVPPG